MVRSGPLSAFLRWGRSPYRRRSPKRKLATEVPFLPDTQISSNSDSRCPPPLSKRGGNAPAAVSSLPPHLAARGGKAREPNSSSHVFPVDDSKPEPAASKSGWFPLRRRRRQRAQQCKNAKPPAEGSLSLCRRSNDNGVGCRAPCPFSTQGNAGRKSTNVSRGSELEPSSACPLSDGSTPDSLFCQAAQRGSPGRQNSCPHPAQETTYLPPLRRSNGEHAGMPQESGSERRLFSRPGAVPSRNGRSANNTETMPGDKDWRGPGTTAARESFYVEAYYMTEALIIRLSEYVCELRSSGVLFKQYAERITHKHTTYFGGYSAKTWPSHPSGTSRVYQRECGRTVETLSRVETRDGGAPRCAKTSGAKLFCESHNDTEGEIAGYSGAEQIRSENAPLSCDPTAHHEELYPRREGHSPMTTQPPLNGVYEYQKTIRHRSISRGAWTETGSANEENVRGPRTPTEGSDGEAGNRGCGTTIREDKHGEQETEEISVPDDKAGKASARAGSRIQRQLAPDREDFEAERKALSKSRANKVGTTHQSHIQYTGGDTRSTAAGSGESGDFNSPIASCFSPTKESGHSSNLVNDKSLGAVSAAMDPLASPSSALARLPDDEQRLTATFLSRRDLLLSLSARLKTLIPNKRGQESQQASEGALQAEVQELPPPREAGAVQRIKYSPREGNAAKRSGSPGIKTAKLQSHETLSARSGSGKHNGSDKKRTETVR